MVVDSIPIWGMKYLIFSFPSSGLKRCVESRQLKRNASTIRWKVGNEIFLMGTEYLNIRFLSPAYSAVCGIHHVAKNEKEICNRSPTILLGCKNPGKFCFFPSPVRIKERHRITSDRHSLINGSSLTSRHIIILYSKLPITSILNKWITFYVAK